MRADALFVIHTYHERWWPMIDARWAALWMASAAQLMVVLDVSVVNIALPAVGDDLRMTDAALQWVASGYALAFAGGLLVGGRLADVYGLRRVFVFGLGVFIAASVIGGLAVSGEMLIAARVVQGVGAAIASPATFTILTRTYPEGPVRTPATAPCRPAWASSHSLSSPWSSASTLFRA